MVTRKTPQARNNYPNEKLTQTGLALTVATENEVGIYWACVFDAGLYSAGDLG
jgi:uncharacterized protein YkwD